MNNKQIQYAIELSKSLNFSQTAEKLGISQPALSKQILSLEKEVGVELFDRKKTPISLTAAGEYFFLKARELLYSEDQLYRSMDRFKNGEFGSLAIGISPFRSLYLLPQVTAKVKEKYPGVKIILHEAGSEQLRREAAEGRYDFAVVNLPVDESVLDIIPIEQDTLVLAVPNSMADKINNSNTDDSKKINFNEFKELPFIVVGQTQEMRQLFDKLCTMAEFIPNIAMEVVGLATAWSMVRAGIGATLLPLQFIKNMNPDDSIKLFFPDCNIYTRQPAIITRHGQYLSDYAKYAIELLKKH